ncbi:MlaE family lipid ABC transporter permease subunit [Halomonadaceae bacterium KBTZ08]
MPDAEQGQLHPAEDGQTLRVTGDWTLSHYSALRRLTRARNNTAHSLALDGIQRLDTAGATLLAELVGGERLRYIAENSPAISDSRRALLLTVADSMAGCGALPPEPRRGPLELLARMGQALTDAGAKARMLIGFIGAVLACAGQCLLSPRRWRVTALTHHMETTGLNAVPIVALLTFAVGAVIAYLGATVLSGFGASVYTVNLVAYAFMREFGVLITAIVLAGRTASAFTAHIGAMNANEELDALRAQGLDPVELEVLPRVLAVVLMLPLLSFIAVLSGLAGGGLIALTVVDIPLSRFITVISEVPLNHFLAGLVKAPFFAFLIAIIGCLEGFKAGGSARSVGAHTTSSVVQSIFVVILLDALAAMYFMEIGW